MDKYENIIDFIQKNKNRFEKRKYFIINEKYEIEKREPSYILELANLYFEIKDENIVKEIYKEFEKTYVEKNKKINRMSKIEKDKLIDRFRRAIINQEKIHSIKLGNELLIRDKKEFFKILYNLSLISQDCNKLVKTYFMEKIIEKMYEINGNQYNKNREIIEEIVKNIINYFVKSENIYLNLNSEIEVKYFVENKIDKLYAKIYTKNYSKIVQQYDIINVRKIVLKKEYYEKKELSESKEILYKFLNDELD